MLCISGFMNKKLKNYSLQDRLGHVSVIRAAVADDANGPNCLKAKIVMAFSAYANASTSLSEEIGFGWQTVDIIDQELAFEQEHDAPSLALRSTVAFA